MGYANSTGADVVSLEGITVVNNNLRVLSTPYGYYVAEGKLTGHSEFERFGYNADIDITEEDIWTTGGTYVFPTTAQQLEIVSSSASDASGGTGIRTVTLYYLDSTYTAKTEDITLNGTNVVTTSAANLLRVNALKAKTTGTGKAAAGIISIRNLTDTPVYSAIAVGQTRSRNSIYTVPLGYTLFVSSVTVGCSATTQTGAYVTLRTTYDHDAAVLRDFFLPHFEVQVGNQGLVRPFEVPLIFPATTDIKLSASTSANNTAVSAAIRGWLET